MMSVSSKCEPLNFCLVGNSFYVSIVLACGKRGSPIVCASYRMLANSLLMRFSSNSRALAFLKSAMNWTRPRMLELLELDRPRKPAAVDDMVGSVRGDGDGRSYSSS